MGFFDYDKDDRSIYHIDMNNDGRKDSLDDFIYEECYVSKKSSSYDDVDEDLEFMDEDERREYCEDNGIDIDDYDD